MRAPTVHLLAAWLAHPTHGVAALLSTAPVIPGGRTPPALAGVLASTTNEGAALGMVPDGQAVPVLVVSPNDEPVTMVAPASLHGPRDWSVPVLVRYVTRISDTGVAPDAAVAECDTDATLRVVIRSLVRWCRHGTDVDRVAADAAVWSLESLSLASLWDAAGDVTATGGVVARFRVRDSYVE